MVIFHTAMKRQDIKAGRLAQITPLPGPVMSPTGSRAGVWERVIRINQDPCLYLSWNNSKALTIALIAFPFLIPLSLEMRHHVRQWSQEVSAVHGKSSQRQRGKPASCNQEGSGNFHGAGACGSHQPCLQALYLWFQGLLTMDFLMHHSAFDDYCQIIFLIWLRKDLTGSVS